MRRGFLMMFCFLMAAAPAADDRFVESADGVRLFVHDEGQGPPVIALHGGPGFNLSYLAPDLQPLSANFRMVYYDQRGTGRSTVVTDAALLTADAMVKDLDRVRESLGVRRVTLLGHSWGAGLAALYAIAHPDRVERLLLVDPMPPRSVPYLEQFSVNLQARFTPQDQAALSLAQARRKQAADADLPDACRAYYGVFIAGYLADRASASRTKGDICAGPAGALRNSSNVNRSVLASLGDFDLTPRMAAVKVPALVVHGDADPIPVEAAREMAASLADGRLLIVKNSGHFPYVEQPEVFFPAAREFLSGKWPAGAVTVKLK